MVSKNNGSQEFARFIEALTKGEIKLSRVDGPYDHISTVGAMSECDVCGEQLTPEDLAHARGDWSFPNQPKRQDTSFGTVGGEADERPLTSEELDGDAACDASLHVDVSGPGAADFIRELELFIREEFCSDEDSEVMITTQFAKTSCAPLARDFN